MIRMVVRRNDFARIAAELAPKVSAVVTATALEVEAGAKERAPVRTGNLRRSLHMEPVDRFHAQVGTDVEYAPYVEYGTSRMGAQPYLTPSVESSRARFVEALKVVIGRG